jgi:hypothetical protein
VGSYQEWHLTCEYVSFWFSQRDNPKLIAPLQMFLGMAPSATTPSNTRVGSQVAWPNLMADGHTVTDRPRI